MLWPEKGENLDYKNINDLTGFTAAITGGASGIGLEAARALGQCGARLELLDLNVDALENNAVELRGHGYEVETSILDVTNPENVAEVAAAIHDRVGPVDVLVNSAGIAKLHSAAGITPSDWRKVMDVNVNGTFFVCQAFGAEMVKAGRGSIVNMGSMSGTIVNRPQFASSYMTSKGAVHQLTKALAVEWANTGVRVNALAPGYIATEMTLGMRSQPELFEEWLKMTPLGRCGDPEEVAALIVFLASNASTYMTGSIVAIDGGYTSL
jgi:NAD(P)-dependent dehydrogenase (short-subunit alcohol dehydrogenase family)